MEDKRFEIELEAWESAPDPIFTNGVDTDKAERMLYQAMNDIYTEQEIEDYLAGNGDIRWRDKFNERLCEEEEKIVIACGGKYYGDIWTDDICPMCSGHNVVQLQLAENQDILFCCDCNHTF